MTKTLRYTLEKRLPVSLTRAWEVFSDTDHFNRFVGFPKVSYESSKADSPFVRTASAKMLGLRLRWSELPFEWVEEQSFSVTRIYDRGPVSRVKGGIEFEADGNTALLRFVAELTPRSILHVPTTMFLARRTLAGFQAYCEEYLVNCTKGFERRGPVKSRADVNASRLQAGLTRLIEARPTHEPLLQKFERHMLEGGDDDVLRMRPYALAGVWLEDRHEVLEFFLHATKAGILTLDWQLMCPNCRVPKAEFKTFRTVAPTYHCDLCGIEFETDIERYTELRFSVSPDIRVVEDALYCIGSPSRSPHVLSQHLVKAHEDVTVKTTLAGDAHRARALQKNLDILLQPSIRSDAKRIVLTLGAGGWTADCAEFTPGEVEIVLRNANAHEALLVLERTRWDRDAATAAEVTVMQEFRDLFGAEVLAPGRQLGVRNLSVLFTDLEKSTELYERVGDATAFSQVHRHFAYLMSHIGRQRGALVKTIGDAVMAVFPSPAAAVQAALDMQRGILAFNFEHELVPPLVLKIGVHVGPAIAVNANGAFDYFGRTVNIAARIQSECVGGEIVLSERVARDPDVATLLASQDGSGLQGVTYDTHLRGIEDSFKLVRLAVKQRAHVVKKVV